jgi:hypothetical protein
MSDPAPGARRAALAQALLVTFLWSTSWVLIRIGVAANAASALLGRTLAHDALAGVVA